MKYSIEHQLRFDPGVGFVHVVQQVLLTPLSNVSQKVPDWSVSLDGMDKAASFLDGFGNRCHLVSQERPSEHLLVTVSGQVETQDRHGVLGRLQGEPMPALYRRATELTQPDPALIAAIGPDRKNRIDVLHRLMALVHDGTSQTQSQDGGAQVQSQSGAAEPDAVGMTHGFIGAARGLGIPARYVTGYLAPIEEFPARFHGWAEAFDEGLGWIGFDCMLNLCPTDRHIRVASGLDAATAQPIRRYPSVGEIETVSLRISS